MSNKRRAKVIGQILLVSVLIAGFLVLTTLLKNKHFLLFSFMLLLCSILPAYWRF
ncbi:ECF transporter S component, partial [Lactobacillus buchneri]|nr:ECF transporter S component [Lentilactobacillus buchneri]MQM79442.1 ECF transporter S component [Lentilactobacillus buchneri]MQN21394.1 ECF transporter S component [Lentilactobacillus buchneri]